LNEAQVGALRNIYSPLRGSDGHVLSPQYDPGGEDNDGFQQVFNGQIYGLTTVSLRPCLICPTNLVLQDWFRYIVYNDSSFTFDNFSVSDVEVGNKLVAGDIVTWSGDFGAFRERGGKFLTYHGRSDFVRSHFFPLAHSLMTSIAGPFRDLQRVV
jgi:feruloyl esterase